MYREYLKENNHGTYTHIFQYVYGCMYREYLKENNPMLYNDKILSCQLWTYLADVNEQAPRISPACGVRSFLDFDN